MVNECFKRKKQLKIEALFKRYKYHENSVKLLEYFKEEVVQQYIKIMPISEEGKRARERIVNMFKEKKFADLCKFCKENCCLGGGPYYNCTELIYFCAASENKFIFPEPDWNFLEKKISIEKSCTNNDLFLISAPCLYLCDEGCSLGDYRSSICLKHTCLSVEKNLDENKLAILDKSYRACKKCEMFFYQINAEKIMAMENF